MAGELNVTGLVNGFDMNAVLAQIQAIKSKQILLLQSQQQKISDKKVAVSDIANLLKNLQTSITNFTDSNTVNAKSVTVSNPNVLTATVTDPVKLQEGVYNVNVTQLATNQIYASTNGVSDKNAPLGLGSDPDEDPDKKTRLTITMNGLDYIVVYDQSYSLQIIADEINKTATTFNGNFRASIINAGTSSNPSYKLVISGTKTGSANSFTISDTGDLVSTLGINSIQNAYNATASINGVDVESDTNTFTSVEGLSFTVSQTGTATITVNKDKGPLLDTLKNLVNAYNNLVDTVKKETGKGGRLSGEYSLASVVNGIFRQMDELFKNGLIKFDKDTGHISINTSKFDDMYNNNLSTLQNILSTTKDKITNYLKPYTDYNGILDQNIKAYDREIKNLQNMIDLQTQRINTEIETLKNQFVRMQMLQAQFNDISARIQATFGLQQNKQ